MSALNEPSGPEDLRIVRDVRRAANLIGGMGAAVTKTRAHGGAP